MKVKKRITALLAITTIVLVLLGSQAYHVEAGITEFTFIHITDTHIGWWGGGTEERFRYFVSQINNMSEQPVFVIVTGVLTEWSGTSQFETYRSISNLSSVPMFHVVGNHDVNFNKTLYETQIGKLYYSFSFGTFRFLVLDTTVASENYGNVSDACINWLNVELSSISHSTPLIVFSHHPLFGQGFPSWRICQNADAVLSLLQSYNAKAFFAGHVHRNTQINTNGTLFVTTNSLGKSLRPSYRVVTVDITTSAVSTETYTLYEGVSPTSVQLNVYPNPVAVGDTLTVEAAILDQHAQPVNGILELYAKPLGSSHWRYITSFPCAGDNSTFNGVAVWKTEVPSGAEGNYVLAVYYPGSAWYEHSYNFTTLVIY